MTVPAGYALAVSVNAFIAGALLVWLMLRPAMRRLQVELEATRAMLEFARGMLQSDMADQAGTRARASIAPRWPDG